MMNFKKYLPITLPVLYVGLKNNWLTSREVAAMINDNHKSLNCDEKTIVGINVNEDEKAIVLEILRSQAEAQEYIGIKDWQLAHLIGIEQSELSIHDKLKEIELQWARFEYPESWKNFIYYLSNKKVDTEEGLYRNFLAFLSKEKEIT